MGLGSATMPTTHRPCIFPDTHQIDTEAITIGDIAYAIKVKGHRSPGPDMVPIEFVKELSSEQ